MTAAAVATTPGADAADPTREQLELAFRQLARPDRWPATLDKALAVPHFRICLRRLAISLGRPRWQPVPVAPGLPRGGPVPPTPAAPPARQRNDFPGPDTGTWKKRGVDMKRRAANDHDD